MGNLQYGGGPRAQALAAARARVARHTHAINKSKAFNNINSPP